MLTRNRLDPTAASSGAVRHHGRINSNHNTHDAALLRKRQPHLGHAFTTILADFLKRHYQPRRPYDISDRHGRTWRKIAQYAAQAGIFFKNGRTRSRRFQENLGYMGIAYVYFTEQRHPPMPKPYKRFSICLTTKEIVFRNTKASTAWVARIPHRNWLTADGNCPDHEQAPERRKGINYFSK